MRIGLNCLFRGKPTGVGNYIINLARNLFECSKEDTFVIFTHDLNSHYFDPVPSNVEKVICGHSNPQPSCRRLWELIVMPGIVNKKKLDIFHCPVNLIPPGIHCRKVVTLLDCQYFLGSIKQNYLRRKANRMFLKYSSVNADRVFTISQSMKNDVQKFLGVNPHKIQVTHLGQNINEMPDRKSVDFVKSSFDLKKPYLLFIGFPSNRKNIPALIRAFSLANYHLGGALELVLGGDIQTRIESDMPAIKKVIIETNQRQNIRFINYVENDLLPGLIMGALCSVYVSLYEGFGLPVIESMACGTPAVVSDIPVMRELCGETALFVDQYSIQSIADGIVQMYSDAQLRHSLSENGKKRAEQFTWKKTARDTFSLYKTIMEGSDI